MSRGLALALKAAVSGSLILYLFSRVDLVSVREAACRAHPEWIALAICLHVVGLGLSAYRWRSLLSIFHQGYGYGYLVRSLLSGLFFNQFLPSTIGGDALRAYQTPSREGERIPAVGVVFVERSIGLIVLLVVGSIAALIAENPVSNVLRYPFLILAFGSIAAFWGVTRLPIRERDSAPGFPRRLSAYRPRRPYVWSGSAKSRTGFRGNRGMTGGFPDRRLRKNGR